MKREFKFWHIVKKDGSYISRARFPTERAAVAEQNDNSDVYPKEDHVPVEVTYTFELP